MKNKILIGCSSFYNTKWIGTFYPEEMPRNQWFAYYCEHFDTYEINATFYKFPTLRVLTNWYNKAPDNFLYSLKLPKEITHIKKLTDCAEELDKFYTVCREGLKQKLGCVLFQLPPSFKFSEENLKLILQAVNPEFKNVVEFRHESWFTKEVYDTLKYNNITFCSVSHPALPDTIIRTTDAQYIRLHGRPKMFYSEYSMEEITRYADAMKSNANGQSYIYFNNTASEAGIVNALQLRRMLSVK